MPVDKMLLLIGRLLVLIGLFISIYLNRPTIRAFGNDWVRLGVATTHPGQEEIQRRETVLRRAGRLFWSGMIATAIGIILQILGGIL